MINKYRVWDKNQNKYINNVYLLSNGEIKFISKTVEIFNIVVEYYNKNNISLENNNSFSQRYIIDNLSLELYTGRNDIKGNELYDGDIVNGGCFNNSYTYGVIFYDLFSCQYSVKSVKKISNGYCYLNDYLEKIGNINENKDLLL